MASQLKPDATIADVAQTLLEPEEYVRVVLGNMHACKQKHKDAIVRIGITGQGKVPSHKVTYRDNGDEKLFGAYDGRNPFTDVQIHTDTWSSNFMTYQEVQNLLGSLRGWKGGKA
jgi:hypothetical protein